MGHDEDPWRRPRSYHHGNLREVLLEAARKLIEQYGPAGFSLTEAARLAGVSPAAPYRHFKDREALLAEVARHGFERFAARLDIAWNNGIPTPLSAFENLGRAYLAFAREEPASYAVMFEAGLASRRRRDLQGCRRSRLQRAAARHDRALPDASPRPQAAGQVDEPAYLGALARRRRSVRAGKPRGRQVAADARGDPRIRRPSSTSAGSAFSPMSSTSQIPEPVMPELIRASMPFRLDTPKGQWGSRLASTP